MQRETDLLGCPFSVGLYDRFYGMSLGEKGDCDRFDVGMSEVHIPLSSSPPIHCLHEVYKTGQLHPPSFF